MCSLAGRSLTVRWMSVCFALLGQCDVFYSHVQPFGYPYSHARILLVIVAYIVITTYTLLNLPSNIWPHIPQVIVLMDGRVRVLRCGLMSGHSRYNNHVGLMYQTLTSTLTFCFTHFGSWNIIHYYVVQRYSKFTMHCLLHCLSQYYTTPHLIWLFGPASAIWFATN